MFQKKHLKKYKNIQKNIKTSNNLFSPSAKSLKHFNFNLKHSNVMKIVASCQHFNSSKKKTFQYTSSEIPNISLFFTCFYYAIFDKNEV